MNWKKWLHGLLGAAIGGVATSVGSVAGSAAVGTPFDGHAIGGAALGGAIAGSVLYLRQSPIPPDDPAPQVGSNAPQSK